MANGTSDIDIAAKARVLAEMRVEITRHQTIARECLRQPGDAYHIAMHERVADIYEKQVEALEHDWYAAKEVANHG